MLVVSFFRIIRFAWQGFWRNFWLSFITISILVLTYLTINFLIILNVIANSSVSAIQDKVDVSLYFENTVEKEKIDEVKEFLQTHPDIKEVRLITADEALKNFRELHQDDEIILESLEELDGNPLGATLIIKGESVESYKKISTIIDNSKYSDIVVDKNFEDSEKFIAVIEDISSKVNRFGIIIASFFVFISLVIVFNTVRVAIYTHKDEITIMKLVGANNTFISTPFFIESMLYALIACGISVLITLPALDFIQPYITSFFKDVSVDVVSFFEIHFKKIFGYQLLGIIVICVLSSSIAIRRYLRV